MEWRRRAQPVPLRNKRCVGFRVGARVSPRRRSYERHAVSVKIAAQPVSRRRVQTHVERASTYTQPQQLDRLRGGRDCSFWLP